ncbi:MAG: hypothetical protein HYX79_00560 [Chloroflexi bacterium]|nr:hypothetical protein [Chloroflexota bacterium]
MATEQTFYSDESGVRITGTRAIFNNTTYSMANISSIRTAVTPPKRNGAIWTIIIGLFVFIGGMSASVPGLAVFGAIILLLGVLWAWKASSAYHIMITSASGETSALTSKSKDYIAKVSQAMNEAIIHRG